MAQWDGIGLVNDWAEFYAGQRTSPPAETLDLNSTRSAYEMAAVILKVDDDRAARFAEYMQRNRIGIVVR